MSQVVVPVRIFQCKSIERCCFVVIGVMPIHSFHPSEVLLAAFLIPPVGMLVKGSQSKNVGSFPCSLSVERARNLDLFPAAPKLFNVGHAPPVECLCNAPMCHWTAGIFLGDPPESSFRGFEGKLVQQGYALLKLLLN